MKKKILTFIPLFIILLANSCTGYKPIFSASNLKFQIVEHSIKGNKRLANQIYSKLYNVSAINNNDDTARSIKINLNVDINKNPTVKNNAGKILEYKIYLITDIIVNDYLTNKELLKQNFNYDSSYKVQDQHSETVKLEKKALENLVDKTSQDLLIKISESISSE